MRSQPLQPSFAARHPPSWPWPTSLSRCTMPPSGHMWQMPPLAHVSHAAAWPAWNTWTAPGKGKDGKGKNGKGKGKNGKGKDGKGKGKDGKGKNGKAKGKDGKGKKTGWRSNTATPGGQQICFKYQKWAGCLGGVQQDARVPEVLRQPPRLLMRPVVRDRARVP